jgi:hypothetical protein
VERVTGIEPAWSAWKAGALPLSYTREVFFLSSARVVAIPKPVPAGLIYPPICNLDKPKLG